MLVPILALISIQASGVSAAPIDLVEVRLDGPRDRELLRRFATDVDDHFHADDRARIFAGDREQERLLDLGLNLQVLREDLVTYYAERASSYLYSGGGSMAGYRTYDEIYTSLNQLAVQYLSIVSLPFSIGTTVEGRPIWAIRISSTPTIHDASKPVVWFDGLHHAREPISGEAVLRLAEYLAQNYSGNAEVRELVGTRNLLFIPCVNPDGYEFNRLLAPSGGGMWRKNMRQNPQGSLGVDLNRNYSWEWGDAWPGSSGWEGASDYRGSAPFSEPESTALRDLALLAPPDLSVSCHSYGNLCLLPWGYDTILTGSDAVFREFSAGFAQPLGWGYGAVWEVLGVANGSSLDYLYGSHRTLALAIEIGDQQDGFWPVGPRIGELCEQLVPGFIELIQRAGPRPVLGEVEWMEVRGDGDLSKEPGETWALEVGLRNEGLWPSAGRLSLHLPAGLAELTTVPIEFELDLQEEIRPIFAMRFTGEGSMTGVHSLRLVLDAEGGQEERRLGLALGEERVLAWDSCEQDGRGWKMTVTGKGVWERTVPHLVVDAASGQTSQPGDDATPTGGGHCWVTGATPGLVSSDNDVDGVTTLVTPRFSSLGFEHLEMEYQRWSTNLPLSGPLQDSFRVEVSADDGLGWVVMEELGHANSWHKRRFDLESFVELSDAMRLRFTVLDDPDGRVVEGLVDDLVLRTVADQPTLGSWGRTQPGDRPRLFLHDPERPGGSFSLRRSLQAGAGLQDQGVEGLDYLRGPVKVIASGLLDAEGRAELLVDLPPTTLQPLGGQLHYQFLVDQGGLGAAHSSLLTITIDR
jgi:hypothetical protein